MRDWFRSCASRCAFTVAAIAFVAFPLLCVSCTPKPSAINEPAVEYVDPETHPQLRPMTEEEFRKFLEDVKRHNVSPVPRQPQPKESQDSRPMIYNQ